MPSYLIDVNLPTKFSLWYSEDFIFVKDIDPFLADSDIWEYAKIHHLTIVTKDRDFYARILLSEPPPRVIHIRFGNLKMNDFYRLMTQAWEMTTQLIQTHKLVLVYKNQVEGIN